MSSDDQQAMRAFLQDARERAGKILSQEHIGADVKTVLKDLLANGENLLTMLNQAGGQSADVRMVKRKLDLAKTELKASEGKLETVKTAILLMAGEIKTVSSEAAAILKRHGAEQNSADTQSANKIRAAAQNMVEAIVKATAS